MQQIITYYDDRAGDTYHVHLLNGRFIMALRYVYRTGSDAITYDRLDEIPDGARHAIEQKIEELK